MSRTGGIGHDLAQTVLGAIRAELIARGDGAAVAVVDTHGELVAFARTDGCPLPSITIAINKAFTAARERVPSAEVGRRSQAEGFPMTNFGDPRFVSWGGGVPITVDGEVIGAVGVSGLPEHVDMELAQLGAAAATPES
jgi:glc operon protein GlcG